MRMGHRGQVDGATAGFRKLAGAVALGFLLLAGEGRAVDTLAGGGLEMPLPPPSHVLDAGDVFARDPEKLAEISTRLKELEKKHGVPVYLAVYSGLIRTSVARQSKDLFDLWVGEGKDGIVMVCDTDDSRIDLGLPKASHFAMDDERSRMTRLPESRIVPIVRELKRDVDRSADPVDYLPEMTVILTTRLDEMLSVKPTSWRDGSAWKVGMVTIAVGIFLAVLGFWVSRFLKQSDQKERESFHFPEVLVRSRLGANCGGGKVAVMSYAEIGESAGEENQDRDRPDQSDVAED